MKNGEERIDIGTREAWNPRGLKQLDEEVTRLAQHHAETRQGAHALRWYLLDIVTDDPLPAPFSDLEQMLRDGERSFWTIFDKQLRSRKGHLNDREVGYILGHETDAPVKRKKWKKLRESVFAKIGLKLGPAPAPGTEELMTFEIGTAPDWRLDIVRALDEKLVKMCHHHAETDLGAETLRWHVWDELTEQPRPIALTEVQKQLEDAEESLMASFSDEVRRAKGHLHDDSIARLLGFNSSLPIVEGYYCQLRENVFARLAHGFGSVDDPWAYHTPDDIEVGRQGAWNRENIKKLDDICLELSRAYAKTSEGKDALRWFLLDDVTQDPEPVNVAMIEQRLRKAAGSIAELFSALHRQARPTLGDAKVARFIGASGPDAITSGEWRRFRQRVTERVGLSDDWEQN